MPFSTKMCSSYSKSYKIEYKATIMFFFVLTVHKYEESNVDLNLFLNCCKLGNCIMSHMFHMCIPMTVFDSSLWVVLVFLT